MTDQGPPLLLVVSGPSGAGKSTVCKQLLAQHPDIALSISVTTRDPRNGERDGRNYFFRTREQFESMLTSGDLLEHAHVYGNWYGTPRSYVCGRMAAGQDVLLEIEMQGALQVRKRFPEAVLIFVIPPSMRVLMERITGRASETPESLMHRFQSAYAELGYLDQYHYLVVNDTIESAVARIGAIITAEKCRVSRNGRLRQSLLEEENPL